MEILSLLILLAAISVFDEILNGQFQAARKLLQWFERKESGDRAKTERKVEG